MLKSIGYILEEAPGGSDGQESASNAEDPGLILDWKDPLEKAMATHSSILAWRIPCVRKGLLTKRVFLLMFDLKKK